MQIRLRLHTIARQNRGWNLRRLATELGVEYQNVLNWNNGRANPRLAVVVQIANMLRCRLDQLIAQPNEYEAYQDDVFKKPPSPMFGNQPKITKRRGRPRKSDASLNKRGDLPTETKG